MPKIFWFYAILKFGICITQTISWAYARFGTDMSGIFRIFHTFNRKTFPELVYHELLDACVSIFGKL